MKAERVDVLEKLKANYRIVPYMRTETSPDRSAVEAICPFGGHWRLARICDSEKEAKASVDRMVRAALDRMRWHV